MNNKESLDCYRRLSQFLYQHCPMYDQALTLVDEAIQEATSPIRDQVQQWIDLCMRGDAIRQNVLLEMGMALTITHSQTKTAEPEIVISETPPQEKPD